MRSIRIPTPALNAFRAGRPVEPIGHRRDGRPIYPIAGGAPDDEPGGDDPDDKGGKDGDDDADEFTPITSQEEFEKRLGKRLGRERAKFSDYDQLKEKAGKYDEHVEASRTEQEKAVEDARKSGETAATERYNAALVEAKAEAALATAKFRNPTTAVRLLDLSGVTVTDGKPDAAAIKAVVDKLAETEPYLVDSPDDKSRRRPKPDRGQGGDNDRPTASVAAGRDLYAEEKARRTKTS